jgi:hypothetical protein
MSYRLKLDEAMDFGKLADELAQFIAADSVSAT